MKKLVQKTGLPKHGELYELHRLLGALLSQDLTIDQKLDIIGNEYDIPIEDKGIAIGEAKTETRIIINMYNKRFTEEQIAAVTDKDIKDVKAIIAGKGLVFS